MNTPAISSDLKLNHYNREYSIKSIPPYDHIQERLVADIKNAHINHWKFVEGNKALSWVAYWLDHQDNNILYPLKEWWEQLCCDCFAIEITGEHCHHIKVIPTRTIRPFTILTEVCFNVAGEKYFFLALTCNYDNDFRFSYTVEKTNITDRAFLPWDQHNILPF